MLLPSVSRSHFKGQQLLESESNQLPPYFLLMYFQREFTHYKKKNEALITIKPVTYIEFEENFNINIFSDKYRVLVTNLLLPMPCFLVFMDNT